jgi:hypothetical protein
MAPNERCRGAAQQQAARWGTMSTGRVFSRRRAPLMCLGRTLLDPGLALPVEPVEW